MTRAGKPELFSIKQGKSRVEGLTVREALIYIAKLDPGVGEIWVFDRFEEPVGFSELEYWDAIGESEGK